jgi:hypothetical protein
MVEKDSVVRSFSISVFIDTVISVVIELGT